jgi:hypothetical protein
MEAHVMNLNDPQTVWLNLTNIGLGLITLVCLVVAGRVFFKEIGERMRAAAARTVSADDHAFHHAELGFTMADGGEKLEDKDRK